MTAPLFHRLSRRDAISAAVGATTSLLLTTGRDAHAEASEPIPDEYRTSGFAIGCQAWSFKNFTAFEAIEKTAQVGGRTIEFFPGQKLRPDDPMAKLDEHATDEMIAAVQAKLMQHNIRAVAYGVAGLGRDEARNRQVFEFARKMGLRTITSEPDPAGLDGIEKLINEFDIRVAIHDHPKRANDPNYRFWDPEWVLSLVKDRDPRIGSCADTGHWLRSGIKPLDALRVLKGRVLQSHLKDLNPKMQDVPYGEGLADVPALLAELRSQKFDGAISIEYERDFDTSMPQIAQCIGFVRGWGVRKG